MRPPDIRSDGDEFLPEQEEEAESTPGHLFLFVCLFSLCRHTSELQQDVPLVASETNSVSLFGVQLGPLGLRDRPRLLRAQPRQLDRAEHHLSGEQEQVRVVHITSG